MAPIGTDNQPPIMALTAEDTRLVQESFARIEPIATDAARLFYGRLFELDPSLEKLFTGDMEEQGVKLMATLKTAVAYLDNVEHILPVLQALGQRHRDYGVEPAHYDTVGEALLWTLQQGLGDAYDDKLEQAWALVYALLADIMITAAENPAPPGG